MRRLVVAVLLSLSPLAALAEDEAPPPKPAGCTSEAHRGFDFWLGQWVVIGQKERPVGHSRITKVLDGCAVLEEWYGFAYKGMSLNTYDPATRLWRQSWTDQNGTVLSLAGSAEPSRMVLRGEAPGTGSTDATRHEIEWTRVGPDEVRQVWRQAKGSAEFATVFDGRYKRMDKKLELDSQCVVAK